MTTYNFLRAHVLEIVKDLEYGKNYNFMKHLQQPEEERTNFLELRKEEDSTKEVLALFEKFKEWNYKKSFKEIDYEETFKKFDLVYNEYEFAFFDFDEFNDFEVHRHKEHGTLISIKDSELLYKEIEYDCILLAEVEFVEGYEKDSIYSWINMGEDIDSDLRQFVYTQEDFLEMKTHLEYESPFTDIEELYDDRVIFLN